MSLLELFVEVDDFCQAFDLWAAEQQLPGRAKRGPKLVMSASEVMTLVIHFHQTGYRDFKSYYQKHVREHLRVEFPKLVSYNRFASCSRATALLLCDVKSRCGQCTGIASVWRSVTTGVSTGTRFSKTLLPGEKPQWGGFTASNSI